MCVYVCMCMFTIAIQVTLTSPRYWVICVYISGSILHVCLIEKYYYY